MLKGQGHRQHFPKVHFSGRAIPMHGVLSSLSVVRQVVLLILYINRFQILLIHIMTISSGRYEKMAT